MKLRLAPMWLIMAWSPAIFAQQPAVGGEPAVPQVARPTVKNIERQTEILRNPGIAVDNAQRVLSGAGDAVPSSPPAPIQPQAGGRIADPTQMTGSFSQALNRINGKPGQNAAAAPALPDIQLSARSIRRQDSKAALIKIGGKTHLIKQGGKFSHIANNTLYEIQVNKIEKDHVEVTVMPMGRQMILQ